jgi:hypothetical protein
MYRLAEYMKVNGITQGALSKLTGVSHSVLREGLWQSFACLRILPSPAPLLRTSPHGHAPGFSGGFVNFSTTNGQTVIDVKAPLA